MTRFGDTVTSALKRGTRGIERELVLWHDRNKISRIPKIMTLPSLR